MKCFYHSSDLDGHCSGAIVKLKYPNCELIPINYGKEIDLDTIEKNEVVYMVDFSLKPFKQMFALNEKAKLFWIDHHATAIDNACTRNFIASGGSLLKLDRAGCELTWEYCFPDKPLPRSVYLLGRYDIWDHQDPDVLPFQYGMKGFENTYPQNQEMWSGVLNDFDLDKIIQWGHIIQEYEKNQNIKICKSQAFETEFKGYKCICINRGFTNSKLFDSIDKYDIMIAFHRRKGLWFVSLYSQKDEINCGKIASLYGGGGHKGAAGFQCNNLPFPY